MHSEKSHKQSSPGVRRVSPHSKPFQYTFQDTAAKNTRMNGSFVSVRWTLKDAIIHMFAQIKQDGERKYSLFSLERNKSYSLLSPYIPSKPWFKTKKTYSTV